MSIFTEGNVVLEYRALQKSCKDLWFVQTWQLHLWSVHCVCVGRELQDTMTE